MNFVWAFLVGGLICVVGQLLIDLTKLTPARILVGYVVAGVIYWVFNFIVEIVLTRIEKKLNYYHD